MHNTRVSVARQRGIRHRPTNGCRVTPLDNDIQPLAKEHRRSRFPCLSGDSTTELRREREGARPPAPERLDRKWSESVGGCEVAVFGDLVSFCYRRCWPCRQRRLEEVRLSQRVGAGEIPNKATTLRPRDECGTVRSLPVPAEQIILLYNIII